ncbi:MAG: hypothetical protein ACREC3_14895 [Methyloceanibacter sp.]
MGLALWPGHEQISDSSERADPLDTKPVWFPKPDSGAGEQVAAADPGDNETIIGGKSQTKLSDEVSFVENPEVRERNAAFFDPNFRACEKSSGDDGIAACDRAIASGNFTGRMLSYLYSDRGFMRMQKSEIDSALADLNKALRSIPPISMPSGTGARSILPRATSTAQRQTSTRRLPSTLTRPRRRRSRRL